MSNPMLRGAAEDEIRRAKLAGDGKRVAYWEGVLADLDAKAPTPETTPAPARASSPGPVPAHLRARVEALEARSRVALAAPTTTAGLTTNADEAAEVWVRQRYTDATWWQAVDKLAAEFAGAPWLQALAEGEERDEALSSQLWNREFAAWVDAGRPGWRALSAEEIRARRAAGAA